MALRGSLELMAEMANLLLQCSRHRGVICRLSHVERNNRSLDGRCEAEVAIVGRARLQSPMITDDSIYIYPQSPEVNVTAKWVDDDDRESRGSLEDLGQSTAHPD